MNQALGRDTFELSADRELDALAGLEQMTRSLLSCICAPKQTYVLIPPFV